MVRRRQFALVALAAFAVSAAASAQTADRGQGASRTKFQDRAPQREPRVLVTATVDAAGRIVENTEGGPVQRIGEARSSATASAGENPCPGAVAIPPDEARRLVETTAQEERFQAEFALSVAKAESDFDSIALSRQGAYGIMQLKPATAQAFGVDICDPKQNIRGGIAFLQELTEKYRNPVYVLAAYNAGESAVLKHKGVPPFAETVGYVASVLNELYQWPAIGTRVDASLPAVNPDLAPASHSARRRPDAPARPSAPAASPEWKGGFVQNFD